MKPRGQSRWRQRARAAAISIALAWAALPASLHAGAAEREVVELEPLLVTTHPSGADERAASVWVILPDASDAPSLHMRDLIANAPGIHIDQPGGPGGRAMIFTRGAELNQTLVFFDNVPMNDPTNSRGGGVDLSLIEPGMVGAAAIVRGPPSVRYGPEALAGVLHLSSERRSEQLFRFATEVGGYGLRRGLLTHGHQYGNGLSLGIGAGYYEEGSRERGTYSRRTFLHGSAGVDGPLNARIVAWHGDSRAESFPDDSGGYRFAELRELEERRDRQTGAAMRFNGPVFEGRWTVTGDVGHFDSLVDSPGVAPGLRDPFGIPVMRDDTRFTRYRTMGMLERDFDGWRISGGIDAQHETGRSEGFLDFGAFQAPTDFRLDRTRGGVFAETTAAVAERVTFIGGIRGDEFSDGPGRITIRGGVLAQMSEATQLRTNAGTGYKLPSFYALANPFVGNPDLKPEKSETIDIGIRRTFSRGLLDFAVFSSRYKDGIDFDPGPPPRLLNHELIRSRGAEVAAAIRPTDSTELRGSLSYNHARSRPGNERMRHRPDWRGSVSAIWRPTGQLALNATIVHVGTVPDTSVPTGGVILDSWTRLDLGAVVRLSDALDLTLAVDNAFDSRYEEAIGFPAQGIRFRGGIRGAF